MPSESPEAEARRQIDRLLDHAEWQSFEIGEEENLQTGRMDYRLADLCILEAKRPTAPDKAHLLKMHLQQAQRYRESAKHIPFLMVSDGELHFLQDCRSGRIERLFVMPTKQQLLALKADPDALREGYIIQPSSLFNFQRKALHEVVGQLVDGRPRLLLEMATGTGKTLVAAEIINEMNRITMERKNRRISVLFLVDRDALEEQSADKLGRDVRSALKVNTIEQIEGRVDVLVAQVATMQNRYDKPPFNPDYFDLILVDEAHRSVHGGVWRKVVEYFDCPQVGLTATPPRYGDDETIAYFGNPIFLYSYEEGVRDGLLAPCIIHRVKTNIDKDGLKVEKRVYKSPDFGVLVHVDNRDWAIVRYYEKNFYGKKCLVFAAGTRQVESFWEKFNEMFKAHPDGHSAQFVVSSHESPAARLDIVREFERPDSPVKVLINLNILTAGFDYPALDLLFMCRYTEHKSLYLQMKGRGSRIPLDRDARILTGPDGNPIKDRFVMVDFVGVTEWENRNFVPHIPEGDEKNPADEVLNSDPVAGTGVLEVDVEVGIAEVEIIDPFEGKENPVVRQLRLQLDAAKQELEQEQAARRERESELATLRQAVEDERSKALAARRDAFRQLILSLRAFAPFAPVTEEILRKINPSLGGLDELNEAFGIRRASLQEHIVAVLSGEGEV